MGTQRYCMVDREMTLLRLCVCVCVCVCLIRQRGGIRDQAPGRWKQSVLI